MSSAPASAGEGNVSRSVNEFRKLAVRASRTSEQIKMDRIC